MAGQNPEYHACPLFPRAGGVAQRIVQIEKDGAVKLDYGGSKATTFPSWGIYSYGKDGKTSSILEQSQNKIEDRAFARAGRSDNRNLFAAPDAE